MGASKSKQFKKHAKVAFVDSELEVLEVYYQLLLTHDKQYPSPLLKKRIYHLQVARASVPRKPRLRHQALQLDERAFQQSASRLQ